MKADLRISIKGDPRTHGVNGLRLAFWIPNVVYD